MKKNIHSILFVLLSLPKTIVFNLITFNLKTALRLPVIVGYNVKIEEMHRGSIVFSNEVHQITPGIVRFGFGGPRGVVPKKRGALCIEKKGKLIVSGRVSFGEGSSLRLSGTLFIGKNFSSSKNSYINCSADGSSIGDDVMLGWDVTIIDGDGHTVYLNGEPKQTLRPYHIGNHVWLCAETRILKGVVIGDESIVAFGSLVTKSFPETNCLIGGRPASLIQTGISWGPYNQNNNAEEQGDK